jgi:hypothetical protein
MQFEIWGVDENGERFLVNPQPPLFKVVVGGKVITEIVVKVTFKAVTNDPGITDYKVYLGTSGDATGLRMSFWKVPDGPTVATIDNYAKNLWNDKTTPQFKAVGSVYNLRSGAVNDVDSEFVLTAQQIENAVADGGYVLTFKAIVVWSQTDSTVEIVSSVELQVGISVQQGTLSMELSAISCSTDVGSC